ncbi:hypothetical protein FisN_13Lh371 [Fistulifera solaris]|uniref:Amine oxidase domain-containing protein n=1 Tax=Fistulifera solaris TaxID=1519565 RepID=A0A1Z5KLD3_FISSO|nr:hypothetical protein FisN_13Lh371 [Fistulifera solaris]|eukprot:GAX27086.1 hypothetical protein FisN_13Lh371 [Fistulifera solaris]
MKFLCCLILVAGSASALMTIKPTMPTQRNIVLRASKSSETHIVVVGAGWPGWGAAKAACEAGARVTLIDALPDPRIPYLSSTGKPVEAGTRGFWKDYPNIQALCRQLNLQPFTPFTNSSFYSPDGLEATAPVFAESGIPQLPSPLGQVLATFPLFERIPLSDRASMVGLLLATVDCLGNSNNEKVMEAYDRMTAHDLFLRFGLSDRLVRDFIKPTLLVGLFKPPEELSALVVMELLYFYALAHMDSFDVQWIRNGTVADSLLGPLATHLENNYNITFLSQTRVETIAVDPKTQCVSSITFQSGPNRQKKGNTTTQTLTDMDGVVLALTSKGMESVVSKSPDLAKHNMFSQAASCPGIDVISVRLWFDRIVHTRTPANVFSRFEGLRGAGGTFFMLDQFQCEHQRELWGPDTTSQGSVVACDFYNANGLMHLSQEELVRLLTQDLLPAAVPAFAQAQLVDSWVGKYPTAVSWFAPGSFSKRPTLHTPIVNLKCAGDWVRLGDREHGAKGLCQERALVTGYEAANALLRDFSDLNPHVVLPVRKDEAQFRAAVALNQQLMRFLPRFWVR